MSVPPANVQVMPLFPTPVALVDVPQADRINRDLSATILQREQTVAGTTHSNLGGYQSSWDMERWGGPAANELLDIARDVATRLTTARMDPGRGSLSASMWKANIWANINRAGHGNEFHAHPGSFWSGVYYVDDGGISSDPSLGGELEFMDPRGVAPAMYAPTLGFSLPGGLSLGASETLPPKAGRMVLFPAWVLHAVRPYRGPKMRISVAFNLSV